MASLRIFATQTTKGPSPSTLVTAIVKLRKVSLTALLCLYSVSTHVLDLCLLGLEAALLRLD